MSFDNHINFGYSVVATAPTPAASGTTIVVAAGDGAKFPAAPFNAVVWPTGTQPTSANAEIVRVTAKATDTFTITRTQESTSARTIVVGDQISNAITAKLLTDIEGSLTDVGLTFTDVTTNNVSTSKHGFAPKAPNDVSKFLRGDASYSRIVNVVTTTSTGTQNDFAPGLVSGAINVIRCNNATDLTLTGLSATSIADGTVAIFKTIGAGNIIFQDQNAGSAAANRYTNIATSGDTPISSSGFASFIYDATSTTWRMLAHEQGAWISYTPTWQSAGNPQPALGNGTLIGGYIRRGRNVRFRISFIIGSTSTQGTSTWTWTLPFTGNASNLVSTARAVYSSAHHPCVAYLNTTNAVAVLNEGNTGSGVASGIPAAWVTGNSIVVEGEYETA